MHGQQILKLIYRFVCQVQYYIYLSLPCAMLHSLLLCEIVLSLPFNCGVELNSDDLLLFC